MLGVHRPTVFRQARGDGGIDLRKAREGMRAEDGFNQSMAIQPMNRYPTNYQFAARRAGRVSARRRLRNSQLLGPDFKN